MRRHDISSVVLTSLSVPPSFKTLFRLRYSLRALPVPAHPLPSVSLTEHNAGSMACELNMMLIISVIYAEMQIGSADVAHFFKQLYTPKPFSEAQEAMQISPLSALSLRLCLTKELSAKYPVLLNV